MPSFGPATRATQRVAARWAAGPTPGDRTGRPRSPSPFAAREARARIGRIFELDPTWTDRPHGESRRLRQTHLEPHVEASLEWATVENDGGLETTNDSSERELRLIAAGRKAGLFCGSDCHAQSAAEIMSLVASAKLHKLDPGLYLREVIRGLPHWPKDRDLELSPRHWAATRTRLSVRQLANELGPLDVPDQPAEAAAEECAAG